MTKEEFVVNIRQDIREEGFMSAMKLAMRIGERARELKLTIDPLNVIASIACEDIKMVEYATWLTKESRRKDLFYYEPK